MRRQIASVALILSAFTATAVAQDTGQLQPKIKDRQVLIDPQRKHLIILAGTEDQKPVQAAPTSVRRPVPLRNAQTLTIFPREEVTFGISRQNPLIYTYKWKGIVFSPSANYQAAAEFAGALTLLKNLEPFKPVEEATKLRLARANPADREGLAARFSKVRALVEQAGLTPARTKKLAEIRNGLVDRVKQTESLRLETLNDEQVGKAQETVRNWKVADDQPIVVEFFKILANARSALFNGLAEDPDLFSDDPGVVATVDMLTAEEATVRRLLTTALEFAAGMAKVGTTLPLGEPLAFRPLEDATATVTVGLLEGSDKLIKAAAVEPQLGDVVITFEPHSSVVFSGGPAAVYVFRNGADDAEDIGFRPVGMLTISSTGLDETAFSPHLEVGVTPDSSSIGLYFGGGFRIRGIMRLSAGVTMQQFKRGDDSDWKPSGYLGLTVDLAPKKK